MLHGRAGKPQQPAAVLEPCVRQDGNGAHAALQAEHTQRGHRNATKKAACRGSINCAPAGHTLGLLPRPQATLLPPAGPPTLLPPPIMSSVQQRWGGFPSTPPLIGALIARLQASEEQRRNNGALNPALRLPGEHVLARGHGPGGIGPHAGRQRLPAALRNRLRLLGAGQDLQAASARALW